MAVADEQQTQQNNEVVTQYTIYGTNEGYTGKVVNIGNRLFTTTGGALEGNSYEVVIPTSSGGNQNTEEDLPTMNTSNQQSSAGMGNSSGNPITRTFTAPQTPRYRRSDNNQLVTVGGKLHQHADGTIMTEHSMGPNDNSVIVNRQQSGTTPPPQSGMSQQGNQAAPPSQGGPGTGGNGGTGGGGMY